MFDGVDMIETILSPGVSAHGRPEDMVKVTVGKHWSGWDGRVSPNLTF